MSILVFLQDQLVLLYGRVAVTPLEKPLSTFFLSSKFAENDYVAVKTTNETKEILERKIKVEWHFLIMQVM